MVKKFQPAALKSAISGLALGPEHPQILPNLQYSDQHLAIFGLSNLLFSGLTSRGASGGLKLENPHLCSQRLYWASGPLSAHLNHWNILSGAMVYQRISNDRKERALYLLLEQGWDIDWITDALGVLSKSTECWEENYKVHGCVSPPKLIMGCPKLLSADMIDDIQQLLQEDSSLLLDKIVEWLALYHDQPISTTTLHDNLWDLSLKHKCLKQAATKRNNAYQTKWIVNMTMNYTADQLVFLDESSKDDRPPLYLCHVCQYCV